MPSNVPPWLPKAMVWGIGTLLVLSCLTGGVLGAGVLVLLVAAEGMRRYTLPHIRERRAFVAACDHEYGKQFIVNFGWATYWGGTALYAANCVKCGRTEHRNEDGTVYVPGQEYVPRPACDCSECVLHGDGSLCDECGAMRCSSVFIPHTCEDYRMEAELESTDDAEGRDDGEGVLRP